MWKSGDSGWPLIRLALLLIVCLSGPFGERRVWADKALDETFPPPTGTAEAKFVDQATARLAQIRAALAEQQVAVPPIFELSDDGLAGYLETPYLAQVYTGQAQHRFLVGRFVVVNQSPEPLELDLTTLRLRANGNTYTPDAQLELKRFASVHWNSRPYSLNELEPAPRLTIPPGQVGSSWIYFGGLDPGSEVPDLALEWTQNGTPRSLDVRLQHRALLGWSRERIGPGGIVAVGRITGQVNPVNLGDIIDDLIQLSTQNVTRVVVEFAPAAVAVEPHLQQWFLESARKAGVEQNQNTRFELVTIPPMIREFHVAGMTPGDPQNGKQYGGNGPQRVHVTLAEAYLAASGSAYEAIDTRALMREIQQGHPLSRIAGLTFGAPRLPVSFLPSVIQLARTVPEAVDDPQDQALRQAAIVALGEFNQPDAVECLIDLTTDSDETVSNAALRSLAGSRFPAQQQALMNLLASTPELQQPIVRALAEYPRRRWSDTLYTHSRSGPVELRKSAIRALNVVGHPQLNRLLIELLDSPEPVLTQLALELLSEREDPASRAEVIRHALQTLEQKPNSQALTIVSRFKVQQAIPALLRAAKSAPELRSQIIQALTSIGDERSVEELLALYPDLEVNEQSAVLRMVAQINPQRFVGFSREALRNSGPAAASTAIQLLQEQASIEAVNVLIETIRDGDSQANRDQLMIQALGSLSTPESRTFLIELRDNGTKEQQQYARGALETLYYSSPANYIYQQALATSRSQNKALAILQLGLVVEADASFPPAYQARAEAHRSLSQYEEAVADYETLLSLDSRWPGASGSLGQTLTTMSRFADSLPHLDRAIELEQDNSTWFSARAHAHSMLEQFEPAARDYRKALELDPENMTALTGVALSLAISGDVEGAIAQLKKGEAQYATNPIFAYNAACTYARAAEYLQKRMPVQPDQEQQIIKLVDSALTELDRSVQLGYKDGDWTRADPDLRILRDNSRFAKALEQMQAPPEKSKGSGPDANEDAAPPDVPKP